MLISPSGLSFFGLSSNHKQNLTEEFYFLAKFIRMQYSEFMVLPTYVRKYIINRIIEDNTPKNN
jgi:sulfur relay (sulfurtransferase) DsrC/TusE family protein